MKESDDIQESLNRVHNKLLRDAMKKFESDVWGIGNKTDGEIRSEMEHELASIMWDVQFGRSL